MSLINNLNDLIIEKYNSIKVEKQVSVASSYEQLANGSDAILILTEWDEFRELKWTEIVKKMVPPAWVFDSRSIVNTEKVKDAGLSLWRLGDGLGD